MTEVHKIPQEVNQVPMKQITRMRTRGSQQDWGDIALKEREDLILQ